MLYISLGVIIIYPLEYGILEIDMKFKICVQKSIFRLYFSIIHTSNNVVIGNLKSCMAVGEIYVLNTCVKFQVWVRHNERDIHVQKIKVQNIFSGSISYCFRELFVYFHKFYKGFT